MDNKLNLILIFILILKVSFVECKCDAINCSSETNKPCSYITLDENFKSVEFQNTATCKNDEYCYHMFPKPSKDIIITGECDTTRLISFCLIQEKIVIK